MGARREKSMGQHLGHHTASAMVRRVSGTAVAQTTKRMADHGNPLRTTGRATPAEKLAAQAAAAQAEEAAPKARAMACCAVWIRQVVANSSNLIAGLSKGARLTAPGHPGVGHIVYQSFEENNLNGMGDVGCEATPVV